MVSGEGVETELGRGWHEGRAVGHPLVTNKNKHYDLNVSWHKHY